MKSGGTPHEPFDPPFLDALEAHVVQEWTGMVWRAVVETTNPMRANQRGARWNPPDEEALYCAVTHEGAAAELEYVLSRQHPPITKPRKIYRIGARLSRVLDISRQGVMREIAPEQDLLGADHLSSQAMGRAAVVLECAGLMVPSARHSAANVVIFVNRLNVGAGDRIELLDPYPALNLVK